MDRDLDTIVLKALKKNPDERYSTVNAFGDDLQRYLDGRPVVARPDRVSYRVSKFVRRNTIAVAAAAVVVVSLAAFAAVSAWQARVLAEQRRIAQVERNAAEQVVRVLIELFETTNPSVRPDGDRMPVGEFLSGAQERSLERLRATPAVRARLQQVFGLIHNTRGQYPAARAALEQALDEQRRLRGADDEGALESLQALGEVAHYLGDDERARTLLEESLDRHRRVFGDHDARTARVLFALAPVVAIRDMDEAGRLLNRSFEIRRATLGPNDPAVGGTLAALAVYHFRRDDFDRATDLFRQALAVFPTARDRRHPIAITILNDFSNLLITRNAHAEAEALMREAIDLGREVLGPETITVANLVNSLGTTQVHLGKHVDAERSFRMAFETHKALLGERHWRTGNVARNVGRSLALQQRYAEALPWMDRALATQPQSPYPGWAGVTAQRAHVLFRLGRQSEAIVEATRAVESLQAVPPGAVAAPAPLAASRVLLGRILVESGRARDAEPPLLAAIAHLDRLGPTHPQRAEASCELARARLPKPGRAEEWERLKQCLPIYRGWGMAEREVVVSLERLIGGR